MTKNLIIAVLAFLLLTFWIESHFYQNACCELMKILDDNRIQVERKNGKLVQIPFPA